MKRLPRSIQVKPQAKPCTCKITHTQTQSGVGKVSGIYLLKSMFLLVKNLEGVKKEEGLTKIVHHIQPICHSIHEQNPAEAQLEQEETILSQILMMPLHLQKVSIYNLSITEISSQLDKISCVEDKICNINNEKNIIG